MGRRPWSREQKELLLRLGDGPTMWNVDDWRPIAHEAELTSLQVSILSATPERALSYKRAYVRGDVFRVQSADQNKKTMQSYFSARFERSFRSHRRDTNLVDGVQLMCAELMAIYVIQFAGLPNGIMLFKGRWYPTPNGVHELDAVTKTPLLRRGLVWETREPFISPELVQSQIVIIERPDLEDRDVVLDRAYDSMIPLVHHV